MSFDVAAFASAEQQLSNEHGDGATVAGKSKLAQRFVLQMMTDKNEVPFSNQGCRFVSRLQTGAIATETDLFLTFNAALGEVVRVLSAEEDDSDPDTEKLARVQLKHLVLTPGSVSLNLQLLNKAGTVEAVTLPLEFFLPGGG